MNETVKIPEGSDASFSVDLKAADGSAAAPLQAFASVVCMTTRTVVREEAEIVGAGSTVDLEITAIENALIRRSNPVEVKRAIVRATYGTNPRQFITTHDYIVQRVRLP